MWFAVLIIYSLAGYIMSLAGQDWDSPLFWCILGLLYALEKAVRLDLMKELKESYDKLLAEEEGKHNDEQS